MLVACWSTKGGTGTTVVAAALSLLLARAVGGAVAADLAGDLPVALGLPPDGDAAGLVDWMAAAPDVPADALGRVEEPLGDGLSLLRRGHGPPGAAREGALLAAVLAADARPVVVDCGRVDDSDTAGAAVAGAADRSLLVLRSCFLAVRRATSTSVRPSGIVLVREEGRAIGASDVESSLGIPVVACVRVTEAVARAVDAGLLASRFPRSLADDLRHAA